MTVTVPPPAPDSAETIEGGVIEDARERQLRHRLRGLAAIAAAAAAVGLLVVLLGGGRGSGAAQSLRDHGSSSLAGTQASRALSTVTGVPAVAQFGLLAPGVGWVANGSGVYLTRNGGRQWTEVRTIADDAELSGSSSSGPSQLTLSLADGGQVHRSCGTVHDACESLVTASPGTSESQRGQIVVTANAGRTWSSRTFAQAAIPGSISFLDDGQGFALGYTPAVHHDPRPSVYETNDGANTWSRVAKVPFQGLLSFASARDGLGGGWSMGAGQVDSAAIYRTSDGGRSWRRTSLCRPATVYACEAPHLFASGRGVVLVTARNQRTGNSQIEVYTTRDNGASWTRHTLPDTPTLTDDPIYIPFSAPNAGDLFAWVSPYLYASSDAGVTWSRFYEPALTPPGAQQALSDITFINGRYGWYANGPLFLYTTDGGRQWTEIGHARWRTR